MKKIVTLMLVLGVQMLSTAQYHPLVIEANTWRGVTYGWGMFNFYLHIEGDSLMNIVPYKKVWSSQTVDGDQYNIGLIREDVADEKVYVWTGETEHLLYDFSAEQGDVVLTWGVGYEQAITITSTETVTVNGSERKKLNFQDGMGPAYWIEGIGSNYGIMDAVLGQIVDYSPTLTCFYESGALVWDNPESTIECAGTLGMHEEANTLLTVWPNPANNDLNISIGNGSTGTYQLKIVSSTGQFVRAEQVNINGTKQIQLADLTPGLYLITLHLDDTLVTSVRVVKE